MVGVRHLVIDEPHALILNLHGWLERLDRLVDLVDDSRATIPFSRGKFIDELLAEGEEAVTPVEECIIISHSGPFLYGLGVSDFSVLIQDGSAYV